MKSHSYRVPRATCRLQFNRDFTFAQATEVADYLKELGISDVYTSPLFQAGADSTHGYDVCGFGRFNPVLGNRDQFQKFTRKLQELGLGLLLDMVPNHMGADLSNAWWVDVLERGQASAYATWFDIDWGRLGADFPDQVLLPTLEDHYGKVLAGGKLCLTVECGVPALAYHDRKFPLSPESILALLDEAARNATNNPAVSDALSALRKMLGGVTGSRQSNGAFRDFKARLKSTCEGSPRVRESLERAMAQLNATADIEGDRTGLHSFLKKQHYRLAFWRVGPEEINYRRFFDVTGLVSLRMELPEVFQATHKLALELLRQGLITGLRIDHPDGLWNPKEYFERLQTIVGSDTGTQRLYVVAEKILSGDEALPSDWPVAGTTGYDFLNRANWLFVENKNRAAFDALYSQFVGAARDFGGEVYANKQRILAVSLISELDALTLRLKEIAAVTREGQDATERQLRAVLASLIAALPVYRTYITENSAAVEPQERDYIEQAACEALRREPGLDLVALDFTKKLLLLAMPGDLDSAGKKAAREFVMRFQQLSGPVMAKGLEDTTFYNFNRLVSLNEVGGSPDNFGSTSSEFHEWNVRQARDWPHSLLASATHDTKRGEDLRARLNVLSEMPDLWREKLKNWRALNQSKKRLVDGQPAPSANDEYLLYQTLVGAWSEDASSCAGLNDLSKRITAYMLKAIKEAKAHTTWTEPNAAYEEATESFVQSVLTSPDNEVFLHDLQEFQRPVAYFGVFNSLAQVLLKLTCPGVPDFYQGTELWDLSLVDPDNRRPVDFERRRRMLALIKQRVAHDCESCAAYARELLEHPASGEVKMFLIWRTLQYRAQHPELFANGDYAPVAVTGANAPHVVAFSRGGQGQRIMAVVPRLVFTLSSGVRQPPLGPKVWGETALALESHSTWYNVITGGEPLKADRFGRLSLAEAFSSFPVAVVEQIQN